MRRKLHRNRRGRKFRRLSKRLGEKMVMQQGSALYECCLAATIAFGTAGLAGTMASLPLGVMVGVAVATKSPMAAYFVQATSLSLVAGSLGWTAMGVAGMACLKIRAREKRLSEMKM